MNSNIFPIITFILGSFILYGIVNSPGYKNYYFEYCATRRCLHDITFDDISNFINDVKKMTLSLHERIAENLKPHQKILERKRIEDEFIAAVEKNQEEKVKLMIERTLIEKELARNSNATENVLPNIPFDIEYALEISTNNGNLNLTKYLISISKIFYPNNTDVRLSIFSPARNGHLDVVKYLVSLGCDIHENRDYVIVTAAIEGHLDILKYLESLGCNIHVDSESPLRWAADSGHLDVVKY